MPKPNLIKKADPQSQGRSYSGVVYRFIPSRFPPHELPHIDHTRTQIRIVR